MKKVILVNPPLSLEERYGKLAKGGTSLPPLGLTILAAVIRKNKIPVEILDAAVLNLSYEDTLKRIINEDPGYVGLTASTVSIHKAAKVAKDLKEVRPNITTLIGGPHLTAVPEETIKLFPQFDVGVVGEGERSVIELLNALENREDLSKVKGLIYRKDDQIINTGGAELLSDLDQLPIDAFDLLPEFPQLYKSSVHKLGRLPTTSLVTSRGCPYLCRFCDNSMFGRKVRAYSSKKLLEIVKHLIDNYGIKDVFFNDDNFVMLKKRTTEFCEAIHRDNIDLTWGCYGRIDNIKDEGFLQMMKDAGCWRISFGMESGSQDILDFYRKNETLEQMERVAALTRKVGIKSKGFFMMGNFLETKETLQKTIDFAKRIKIDDFHVTFLTPFPGSEIYDLADDYGTFDKDWTKMNMWSPVFIPKGLNQEMLEKYKKKAILGFYLRPRMIWSYLRRMNTKAGLVTVFRLFLTFLQFSFGKSKK